MSTMKQLRVVICLAVAWSAVCCVSANATPIIYAGALTSGVTAVGSITQPSGSPSVPVGAEYYSFFATSGDSIEVFGDRLDSGYDMSFWVMDGVYADTDDFGGFLPGAATLAVFGDDEDAPNLAGPFGDPHAFFIAPLTGLYTVAVTNFASTGGGPFGFELTMNNFGPVPEPGTMGFLAGLGGLGMIVRRASKRGRATAVEHQAV
jgi:PEP-CTERM motif